MSKRRRTASGRYYRWREVVAELRLTPGRWVLMFPHHPAVLAKHVRLRRAPELILEDGVIQSRAVNKYRDPLGKLRADIWLRFAPHPVHYENPNNTPQGDKETT